MKSKLTAILIAVAILSGCAGVNTTGKSSINNANLGAATGALLGGLLGSQAGKGNGKVAMAALGAVAGGMMGQAVGRSMDENEARRAAEQVQSYYPREAFRAQIETYPLQERNAQGQMQETSAVKALNFDVARYAVITNPAGGLSKSAIQTLQKLNGYAVDGSSTLTVIVPPQDFYLAPAIRGQAPGAQVYQSPDVTGNKWVFTVTPRA